MNPLELQSHSASARQFSSRAGMSLLEVLIALGILAAGLASVAAIMPAASMRLADATAIDRAGTLAANAHADLRNRGILTSSTSLFPNNTVVTASTGRVCVIGPAFPDVPFASGTFRITSGAFTSGTFNKYPNASLPSTFSMTLQDDIQLSGNGNQIVTNTSSVTYAATILPTTTGTVSAGSPVRVGVVVFKQPNVDWMQIPLIKIGAGVFYISPTIAQHEPTRKRFLPACSWAFATSGTAPSQTRWLRVGSSWTMSGTSYVSFSDAEADIVKSGSTGSTLTLHSFTNVLRVDERPAILK